MRVCRNNRVQPYSNQCVIVLALLGDCHMEITAAPHKLFEDGNRVGLETWHDKYLVARVSLLSAPKTQNLPGNCSR